MIIDCIRNDRYKIDALAGIIQRSHSAAATAVVNIVLGGRVVVGRDHLDDGR